MFDHVLIRVSSLARSGPPLRAALGALGIEPTRDSEGFASWGRFLVLEAGAGGPGTHALHIAFIAPSPQQVDAFWTAGLAAGLNDDGAPGLRPHYADDYYAAFLRDADSNSIEAVHHLAAPRDGLIDHVTVRVADLSRSTQFYGLVAAAAGLQLRPEAEGTALTDSVPGDALLLLPGTPTEGLHLAFPAAEASVRRFHVDATRAGYRDNGEPGPRPQYGGGYFAAFVLDPDGNNVELVDHEPQRG